MKLQIPEKCFVDVSLLRMTDSLRGQENEGSGVENDFCAKHSGIFLFELFCEAFRFVKINLY